MLFVGLVLANINVTFSVPDLTTNTTGAVAHQASNLYTFGLTISSAQFDFGEAQGSHDDSDSKLSGIVNGFIHTTTSIAAADSDRTVDGRPIKELGNGSSSIDLTVASYMSSIINKVTSFDWSLVHDTVRLASATIVGPRPSPTYATDSPTLDVSGERLAPVSSTAAILPELLPLEHVVTPRNSTGNYSTLIGPTATPEQLIDGISSTDYRPRSSGSYICYRPILVSTSRLAHGISLLENPTTGQTPQGFRRDGCDWRFIDTIRKPAANGINTSQAVIDGDYGAIALASFTFAVIRRLVDLFARIAIKIAITFA
ncbi:hypothetical protein FRB98_002757, partial [Tulasnella sp. 332]